MGEEKSSTQQTQNKKVHSARRPDTWKRKLQLHVWEIQQRWNTLLSYPQNISINRSK